MPSTRPKSNDQLPPPDADKLKLLEARIDEAREYVAEQTSQSERHREAFDELTPPLEEALNRFQDELDVLKKKFETQRKRGVQNELNLQELATTVDLMHDSFDRKIRGVFYQLENPEFKQMSILNAIQPAKGSYEDWLELGTLPK